MKKKMLIILIPLLIIVIATLAILPPSLGKMPKGHALSEKAYLDKNGMHIGMEIISDNVENPVLIFCGGGPGIPQYLMESFYPSVLPKYFTVCYFDYEGTGISYSDIDLDTMTKDRFIEETLLVTEYLKDRFGQEKIYIMGHSFGTYVALNTVAQHPENYIAYLAVSQVCDQRESEIMAYDYMRSQYEAMGDTKMVTKFDEYDIKNNREDLLKYCSSSLRDKAMHKLGVGTTKDIDNVVTDIFFRSLRVRSYTPMERINIWRGKVASKDFAVHEDTHEFNAFEEVKKVDVPVYFFAGEDDMTCCAELQEKYFEELEAPDKKFFLYEGCAHSPIYEDSSKTEEILKEILS